MFRSYEPGRDGFVTFVANYYPGQEPGDGPNHFTLDPLGVYEIPPFDQGTHALAQGLAGSDAQTIIGGGDLVAALQELGIVDRMSFVSTGGGATLEFLEGKTLPGIAALQDAGDVVRA